MSGAGAGADEDPNYEPRLLTWIDGEEARLLVHIEPIDDDEAGARIDDEPPALDE
jgi:hypothetical protein